MFKVLSLRARLLSVGIVASLATMSVASAADASSAIKDDEILKHFQAVVKIDSTDPPGREVDVTRYLQQVLQAEGIDVQVFAKDPNRPNLVARLKGNGSKKPLLLMAHQDTVNVDPAKWKFPPFSAARDGGWIYGRGTVDDKKSIAAALMTVLTLKRSGAVLDRDVIFLAEAGEEGSTKFGIEYMVDSHYGAIDAEYCLAEGGDVARKGGKELYTGIQVTEKLPRAIGLIAHGVASHGSKPTQTNAVVRLTRAVDKVADWVPPVHFSDATTSYFSQMAKIAPPAAAARYRAVLNPGSSEAKAAIEYFRKEEPQTAALLYSTMSPTMMEAGYRINVIPSEAKATLDTRLLPDEDPERFLAAVKAVVNDPDVDVVWLPRDSRPGASSSLGNSVYKTLESEYVAEYKVPVLPVTSTGATDMSFLRAKGMQCYGIGAGIDDEDALLGFGMHSDQERIIEKELYRFVHTYYRAVEKIAAKP